MPLSPVHPEAMLSHYVRDSQASLGIACQSFASLMTSVTSRPDTPNIPLLVIGQSFNQIYRVFIGFHRFFFRIQLEVVAVEKVPFNFEFRSLRAQSVENYFGRRYLGGKFWGLGYFPISILNIIWCEVQKFSDSASGSFRLPGTHFFFSGNVASLKNRIRSNAV